MLLLVVILPWPPLGCYASSRGKEGCSMFIFLYLYLIGFREQKR